MSPDNKCCCCVHVRTGTSVWSSFLLFSGLLCAVYSTLLLTNAIQVDNTYFDTFSDAYSTQLYHQPRSAYWIGLGNGVFLILLSGMSLYGLNKNRAGYLLPMFIVMLFDFLCTIIYIGSLMFYWPKVRMHIMQCRHMPEDVKEWLLNIDDQWLALIVFSILFLVLVFKSYLISMVYRCYKFITTQAVLKICRRDPEITFVADADMKQMPTYKPPNYSDIQKVPLVEDVDEVYDTKPPAYSA